MISCYEIVVQIKEVAVHLHADFGSFENTRRKPVEMPRLVLLLQVMPQVLSCLNELRPVYIVGDLYVLCIFPCTGRIVVGV